MLNMNTMPCLQEYIYINTKATFNPRGNTTKRTPTHYYIKMPFTRTQLVRTCQKVAQNSPSSHTHIQPHPMWPLAATHFATMYAMVTVNFNTVQTTVNIVHHLPGM